MRILLILLITFGVQTSYSRATNQCSLLFPYNQLEYSRYEQHLKELRIRHRTHLLATFQEFLNLFPAGIPESLEDLFTSGGSDVHAKWRKSRRTVLWKGFGSRNVTLSFFKNGIFVNKFFANHRFHESGMTSTAQLTTSQFWLKWSPQSRRLSLELNRLGTHLFEALAHDNGDIVLYRGLNDTEAPIMREVAALKSKGASNKTLLDFYKKKIMRENRDSLFFSGSLEGAAEWSENIVKIRIPRNVWETWTDSNQIFVGIEYGYIEAAFFNDETLIFLLRNFRYHR